MPVYGRSDHRRFLAGLTPAQQKSACSIRTNAAPIPCFFRPRVSRADQAAIRQFLNPGLAGRGWKCRNGSRQPVDRSAFQRPGIFPQPPRRRWRSPLFLLFKTPRFTADTGSTFAFWTLLNLIESNCYLIVYKITIVKKQQVKKKCTEFFRECGQ